MRRPWAGMLARWLTRGPARAIAVIMTGCLAAAFTVALALTGPGSGSARAAADTQRAAFRLTRIHHVWVIELENTTFSQSFGKPSADPELARVLVSQGALLKDYYGIGHDSLDNYIAEISGQAPNVQTGQDCEYFSKFLQFGGENFGKWTKDGQLSGDGCVYPRYVRNIGSQLSAHGLSWKSYTG